VADDAPRILRDDGTLLRCPQRFERAMQASYRVPISQEAAEGCVVLLSLLHSSSRLLETGAAGQFNLSFLLVVLYVHGQAPLFLQYL
jgi:hypothetical protein